MTPIERAAERLQSAWDGGEAEGLPPIVFSQAEAVYLARAVLQAIREPSEGMLEGFGIHKAWVRQNYQAMIDKALSE